MLLKQLRRHFIVGAFTIAPFALTAYVVLLLARWFDSLFQPAVRVVAREYFGFEGSIPVLGIFLGLAFIILVGWLTPSFIGKQTVSIFERVVDKIPIAKLIYSAARQIMDAFSQSGKEKFSRVVMVEFPKEGSYVIGFVTQEAEGGWVPGNEKSELAVFVPTTPNPTSGYLLFVNADKAVPVDVTVEEGLKIVISGGLAKPRYVISQEKTSKAGA